MQQLVIAAILIATMSTFSRDVSSQNTRPDGQEGAIVQTAQIEGQETTEQTLGKKNDTNLTQDQDVVEQTPQPQEQSSIKETPQLNEQDSAIEIARSKNKDGDSQTLTWRSPLVIVQCLWMALIAIGAPLYSKCAAPENNKEELRGLNLPRGSIRGILALLAVGSFVNVLVLGAPVLGDHFDSILAAFGTLTGAMTGFYFANRSATTHPNLNSNTEPQTS